MISVANCLRPSNGLPERDLQKLPNDFVSKKYGRDTAKKFNDFTGPCGGIPRQPGVQLRVQPGRSTRFSFDVENGSNDARCKLTLSCPNKSIERILWEWRLSRCQDLFAKDVMIPRDVGPCGEGECYVQWSMETKSDKFCNCADVVVETPQAPLQLQLQSRVLVQTLFLSSSSSVRTSLTLTTRSSSSTALSSSFLLHQVLFLLWTSIIIPSASQSIQFELNSRCIV